MVTRCIIQVPQHPNKNAIKIVAIKEVPCARPYPPAGVEHPQEELAGLLPLLRRPLHRPPPFLHFPARPASQETSITRVPGHPQIQIQIQIQNQNQTHGLIQQMTLVVCVAAHSASRDAHTSHSVDGGVNGPGYVQVMYMRVKVRVWGIERTKRSN